MSDFLIQTLVWTGALIALVLVLRRPVARHFGPRAAYALWALPALRLAMPPLVLPSWLAPAADPSALLHDTPPSLADQSTATIEAAALPPVPIYKPAADIDFATILLGLWLIGTTVFLVRRFALYRRMRGELLATSRPVGEAGGVRLVETDAVEGPLAFGVIDRVVALPTGFLTTRDRRTRDLAIAHELAHHRGRDLLVNMLVQPLFALHWFNPLGWMGWTAMRRDQEAACDARVVAHSDAEERATYAAVIASFATQAGTGGRPALAAPMACPVLGDKSIIHRLRSLTMTEITPRRRMASRALLVGGALALPLTATITYAETIGQEIEAPTPPSPPAPPLAPDAPLPPTPPEPGELDDETREEIAEMEQELDEIEDEVAEVEREIVEDGQRTVLRVRRTGPGAIEHHIDRSSLPVSKVIIEDREKFEASMEKARRAFAARSEEAEAIRARVEATVEAAPRVVFGCLDGQRDTVATRVDADGKTTTIVCRTNALSMARQSILAARSAIAKDRTLPAEAKAEALRSMDEALAEVEASRLQPAEG